jgi:succinate dehydrogenase hydrophobic anchor subunit
MAGALTSERRLLSSAAVIAAATIFGLTYSLTAPLIAVDLANRAYSEAFIGVNAACVAVLASVHAGLGPVLRKRAATTGL